MAHRNGVVLQQAHDRERPIGELFSQLAGDMSILVRKELELAKVELRREGAKVAKDAVSIGIGGALLYAGVLTSVATLVLALIHFGVTPWLASLITGLVVLFAGYALLQRGRDQLKHDHLMPRRATRQARETVEWAKEQV